MFPKKTLTDGLSAVFSSRLLKSIISLKNQVMNIFGEIKSLNLYIPEILK